MSQTTSTIEPTTATSELPTPTKVTAKDPATKLAHQRLSVLQLAEALGSVSEACRRSGMDRTSFYEWKRRFQTHGLAGLKDLPPVHKSHPQTTPDDIVQKMHMANTFRCYNVVRNTMALRSYSASSEAEWIQYLLADCR